MILDEDRPLRMTCRADALTRQNWHRANWNRSRARNGAIRTTLFTTSWLTKKSVSTLGTKRTSDYHTLYRTPSRIWRERQSKDSSSCSSLLYGMKHGLITQHSRQTKIISPSEDIQSNTVSKEHHDNCLERPQRFASCIFPWTRWHCLEFLWYNWEVTAGH
jgi:hypothetical protein